MWIVLIGASESILRRAPKLAQIIDIREGTECVVVQDDYIRGNLPQITQENVQNFLVRYCGSFEFKRFVSFTERYLLLAAYLNDVYDLQANSISCVKTLCDKSLMRVAIAERGGAGEVWSKLTPTAHLKETLENIEFDVILKPVDGSGSNLISKYNPENSDVDELVQKYSTLNEVLIEQYISGKEFSVEALSQDKIHRILSITEKEIDAHFIESGHTVPANISSELEASIQSRVLNFLDTVGLHEGPSHTEVIVNDHGVHIIEGHPRTGGDRIVSLVRLTSGIDLIGAYLHQLTNEPYKALPVKAPIAKVAFVNLPTGCSYSGLPDLSKYIEHIEEIEMNVNIGDEVHEPTHSGDRHSLVVIHGETYSECNDIATSLVGAMLTSTSGGESK
ncbi:ATP-grasp domain-containing protein [Vibrio cholerae]|nr:ATP-grasp domain-containing protein [Vibrio cholerae]